MVKSVGFQVSSSLDRLARDYFNRKHNKAGAMFSCDTKRVTSLSYMHLLHGLILSARYHKAGLIPVEIDGKRACDKCLICSKHCIEGCYFISSVLPLFKVDRYYSYHFSDQQIKGSR